MRGNHYHWFRQDYVEPAPLDSAACAVIAQCTTALEPGTKTWIRVERDGQFIGHVSTRMHGQYWRAPEMTEWGFAAGDWNRGDPAHGHAILALLTHSPEGRRRSPPSTGEGHVRSTPDSWARCEGYVVRDGVGKRVQSDPIYTRKHWPTGPASGAQPPCQLTTEGVTLRQNDPSAIHAHVTQSALDRNWRIEEMLHLGGMTADEALPAALQRALEDYLDAIGAAVGVPTVDGEALLDWVARAVQARKFGFLVCAATPFRTYSTDADTYTCTWGHYTLQWFYGETLAGLVTDIEAWVQAREADDRARTLKAA